MSGGAVEAGRIADDDDGKDRMNGTGQSQDDGCVQRASGRSLWMFGLWMIMSIALRRARYVQDSNCTHEA